MSRAFLLDLGVMGYAEAWHLQKRIWQMRVEDKIPDTLLLVEHEPVITLGKSGKAANLLVPEPELKRRGIDLFRVERGGDITYHGPGQLVGYPVFLIREAIAGVRGFVFKVEQALIDTLKVWGIKSELKPKHTGVWVGEDKIAALGVAVSRRVSFHGFALNVNTDLSPFQLINPCGFTDKGVTSMARLLGKQVSIPCIRHQVAASFETAFGIELQLMRWDPETGTIRSHRRE